MKCNQAGLDITRKAEGLELTAYFCPAGKLTIGYGHTGPDVVEGMTITEAQANDLLAKDVAWAEEAVTKAVTVPLTSNQFSALVDFTFNVGSGNLETSTLLKLLNAGDYAGAADQFPRWDKANGQVLPGLQVRREEERTLFLTADAPPSA